VLRTGGSSSIPAFVRILEKTFDPSVIQSGRSTRPSSTDERCTQWSSGDEPRRPANPDTNKRRARGARAGSRADAAPARRGRLLRFFRASRIRVPEDVTARKHVGTVQAHRPEVHYPAPRRRPSRRQRWLSRPGARCRDYSRSVSLGRSPNSLSGHSQRLLAAVKLYLLDSGSRSNPAGRTTAQTEACFYPFDTQCDYDSPGPCPISVQSCT
jgi:hypothetical protein